MVNVANQRLGCSEGDGLRAALQLWCVVQSLPEPGLAILGCGKRDVSFDMGLPVPLLLCPLGGRSPMPTPEGWHISALNDQHAYLRTGDAADGLQVGDRIALGISHPCTTFDKWRWMPVVDEGYTVVDAITTCF
jgi:D-serine dehydratase